MRCPAPFIALPQSVSAPTAGLAGHLAPRVRLAPALHPRAALPDRPTSDTDDLVREARARARSHHQGHPQRCRLPAAVAAHSAADPAASLPGCSPAGPAPPPPQVAAAMRLKSKHNIPDHWRRAVRLGVAVFCLSALGFTWIGVPGREPAVLLLKWACLTLPVVTMPLLGKASLGVVGGGRRGKLLQGFEPASLSRLACGAVGKGVRNCCFPPRSLITMPLLSHTAAYCSSVRTHPKLQTTQVGAERVLGTIIGGLLGLLADGIATKWWTLVRRNVLCRAMLCHAVPACQSTARPAVLLAGMLPGACCPTKWPVCSQRRRVLLCSAALAC